MIFVDRLRRLVTEVQKNRTRRGHKFRARPIIQGFPGTSDPDMLDELCHQHFAAPLSSVSHQHLSAWKSSGAYRLFIKLAGGRSIRLILKEANYDRDEIPAMEGLPVQPGLPEFIVYSQPSPPITSYLPKVYLAEEIVPGKKYRYVLEDLGEGYLRVGKEDNVVQVSGLLPALHEALEKWAQVADTRGLIHYDRRYTQSLQEYAWSSLVRYQSIHGSPKLQAILHDWENITAYHSAVEAAVPFERCVIHGDTKFTNLYISNDHDGQLKLVDWEWAGFGWSLADLASLLKGLPASIQQRGYQQYMKNNPLTGTSLTEKQFLRLYDGSQFERGLLDASFLAAQLTSAAHPAKFDLHRAVQSALNRMHAAYLKSSNRF